MGKRGRRQLDPWEEPTMKAWLKDARVHLIPKMHDADTIIHLVPDGEGDLKYAIELGLSIIMDKPIIAVAIDGRPVPAKLALVADRVVHMTSEEFGTKAGQAKFYEAMESVMGEDPDGDTDDRS